HEPVTVPAHASPFALIEHEAVLWDALGMMDDEEILPSGYGIQPNEWEDGAYPTTEDLIVSGSTDRIELPVAEWQPRAERWCRGLYILNSLAY
ncbi:hypothetical protein CPB83DRAFT_746119, partial [Crepidotus variabilis]